MLRRAVDRCGMREFQCFFAFYLLVLCAVVFLPPADRFKR